MSRRRGGDGVSFKMFDGDGALMDLIILNGAVMVFNCKLRADLYLELNRVVPDFKIEHLFQVVLIAV